MKIDLSFDEDVLLKSFFDATDGMTMAENKSLRKEFEKGEFSHKWSHGLRCLHAELMEGAEKAADISV